MKEQYPGIFIGDFVILRDSYLARVMKFALQDCKVCVSFSGDLVGSLWVPITQIKPWRR